MDEPVRDAGEPARGSRPRKGTQNVRGHQPWSSTVPSAGTQGGSSILGSGPGTKNPPGREWAGPCIWSSQGRGPRVVQGVPFQKHLPGASCLCWGPRLWVWSVRVTGEAAGQSIQAHVSGEGQSGNDARSSGCKACAFPWDAQGPPRATGGHGVGGKKATRREWKGN